MLSRHHVDTVPVTTICEEAGLQPSVFYHCVQEAQITHVPLEVREDPARDEDDGDAPASHLLDRGPDVRVEPSILGDGAVVVQGGRGIAWRACANQPTGD